jgi:hypothetical protein
LFIDYLGIVLWEIFNSIVKKKYQHPYPPEAGDAGSCLVFAHVVKGLRPGIPKNFPVSVMKWYVKCVTSNPFSRPEMAQIVQKIGKKWTNETTVTDWKYTDKKHSIQFEVSGGSYSGST